MRKLKKDNTIEEVAAIIRGDQPERRKKPRGSLFSQGQYSPGLNSLKSRYKNSHKNKL